MAAEDVSSRAEGGDNSGRSKTSITYLQGLQRFCAEYKVKLSEVDYLCLTRVCSETVGGLPGLLLTLSGNGKEKPVNLWGPSDLNLLVSSMKSFVPHAAINHKNPESDVISEAQSRSSKAACLSEELVLVCKNKDVKISAILLKPSVVEASTIKPCDVSVVYICELTESRGSFTKIELKPVAYNVDINMVNYKMGNL